MTKLKFPPPNNQFPELHTNTAAIASENTARQLLRYRDVEAKTDYCERQIRRKVRQGTFPAPEQIGNGRERGWQPSVIDAWLAAKEGV